MANVAGLWCNDQGDVLGYAADLASVPVFDPNLGQVHAYYRPVNLKELVDGEDYGALPGIIGDSTKTATERLAGFISAIGTNGTSGFTVSNPTDALVGTANPVVIGPGQSS